MSASGSPANTKPESVRRFWSYRSSRCGSSGRSPQRCSSRDAGRGWKYHLLVGFAGVVIDGIVITAVVRVGFPILLQGWTGFGPMGVAMTLMTWRGVIATGWVVIACTSAIIWERIAPAEIHT